MIATSTPDLVQVNALNFAPFSNANRDEAGHPKTMLLLGTTRGRWSAQSVKAALRVQDHLGPLGVGVRSRNLAVGVLERVLAAGVPDRLAFAAAEVARGALGNGGIRPVKEILAALAKIAANTRDHGEEALSLFPPGVLGATKAKGGRGRNDAGQTAPADGEGAPEGGEANKENGADGNAAAAAKMAGAAAHFVAPDGSVEAEWSVRGWSFAKAAEATPSLRKDVFGVFRAEQPLLHSRHEVAWAERLAADVAQGWQDNGAAGAARAIAERAPRDKVVSPMPEAVVDADIALFGRMVANLPEATVTAAASVSHAMTVGRFQVEADFFTACEERPRDRYDLVGHMGHAFWGTGIYHRFLAIDMNQLRANLSIGRVGAPEAEISAEAERVAAAAVRAFATTLPRGKSANAGSFSPASYVLVERGTGPATNLAVAFSSPVPDDAPDPMAEAVARIRAHKAALSRAYGSGRTAELCVHPGVTSPGETAVHSMDELLAAVARP